MAIFTNQAILSYRNGAVSSNIVTGEILEVLSVTKTAVVDTYRSNENVTYVVSIVNSGTLPYNGIVLTDDLGTYTFGDPAVTVTPLSYIDGSLLYYVNGALTATSCCLPKAFHCCMAMSLAGLCCSCSCSLLLCSCSWQWWWCLLPSRGLP